MVILSGGSMRGGTRVTGQGHRQPAMRVVARGPPEFERERASLGMPALTRKFFTSPRGSVFHLSEEPPGLLLSSVCCVSSYVCALMCVCVNVRICMCI